MIDSHCHLNFDNLANDFENLIRKAKKNNITSILSVNTDPEEFNNHYKLIKKFKLSEEQAEAILNLKLRNLAKLEEIKISKEL